VFVVVLLAAQARNWKAWLILLPAFAIHALWLLIKTISSFSSETALLAQIFIPLYIAIALLFALADRLARPNRFASFLLAAAVLALAGLASFLAYNFGGTVISEYVRIPLTFYATLAAAFLFALTITAFFCRKRYSHIRFLAWLLCWAVVLTIAFICIFGWYDYRPVGLDDVFEILVIGAIFGVCLFGVVLPFMILAFTSSFYRRPFYNCLRLPPVSPETGRSESEPSS